MPIPPAVRQNDQTACWAASLEWWARATGRTVITQNNLLVKYVKHWNSQMYLPDGSDNPDYGTISRDGLLEVWKDSIWNLNVATANGSVATAAYMKTKIARGPCLIGYYEPKVKGKHVVCPWSVEDPTVGVMNPDGGKIENKPLATFQGTTEILIAWPK
jgi:hypothetical protein